MLDSQVTRLAAQTPQLMAQSHGRRTINDDTVQFAGLEPIQPALDIPGLTSTDQIHMHRPSDRGASTGKLVIVMVGLPARGKSYVTKKLARYLSWRQHKTRVFNVGDRRRHVGRALKDEERLQDKDMTSHDAAFFDPSDEQLVKLRDGIALHTLNELLDWLTHTSGKVGILDATNSTIERRKLILNYIRKQASIGLNTVSYTHLTLPTKRIV